jgi:hypothetical protein
MCWIIEIDLGIEVSFLEPFGCSFAQYKRRELTANLLTDVCHQLLYSTA